MTQIQKLKIVKNIETHLGLYFGNEQHIDHHTFIDHATKLQSMVV